MCFPRTVMTLAIMLLFVPHLAFAQKKTTIVYINGIATSPLEVADAALELRKQLLNRLGWQMASTATPRLFTTFFAETAITTASPSAACWIADLTSLRTKVDATCPTWVGEKQDQALEVLQQWIALSPKADDVTKLTQQLTGIRRDGRRVLLIGHSAASRLVAAALVGQPADQCIGAVLIAPPATDQLPAWLNATSVAAASTDARDLVWRSSKVTGLAALPSATAEAADARVGGKGLFSLARVSADRELHYIGTYLSDAKTTPALIERIKSADQALVARCP